MASELVTNFQELLPSWSNPVMPGLSEARDYGITRVWRKGSIE